MKAKELAYGDGLKGIAGIFARTHATARVPAWVTFASMTPVLEIAHSHDEAIQAVEDLVNYLRGEYRDWRRDPTAELPHLPLSQTNSRLLDLTLIREFDALNLPARRCVVTTQ